ncbi:GntR family transcriptional regulator [Alicyclobacillus sp. ALC3]|nr:GntR family transcriptional regulator [Alicyclobacillus sp. ALC3]
MQPEQYWHPPNQKLDSSRPLYEQFEDIVRSSLARGELQPGQRLPPVREFAAHFRVNPNTVMRAYQSLERQGFIATFRGQGTFAVDDPAIIEESRRALARQALGQLERVAQSLGITVDELLKLAQYPAAHREGGENA